MRGMNELTVNEIIEYLNTESFDSFIPELLKIRIRNIFDLTNEEANRVIKRYESIKEAARDNLIESNCIRRALEGIYKTSCGYKWCYENK